MKIWYAYMLVLAGCILAILGGTFIVAYVWEAIISRMGEPDQSLLFWYLPILFLGLAVCGIGLSMFFLGITQNMGQRGMALT